MLSPLDAVGLNQQIQRIVGNPRTSWQEKPGILFGGEDGYILREMVYAWEIDPKGSAEEYVREIAEAFSDYTTARMREIEVAAVEQRVRSILEDYKNGDSSGAHVAEDVLLSALVMATAHGHVDGRELCRAALPLLKTFRTRWYE